MIPNAYFREMKREQLGRLVALDNIPETSVRYSNESWYEHLLCAKCEQKVGQWEVWAIEALRKASKLVNASGNEGVVFPKYDFRTLSLFLLSILWRASIASLPQFDAVKLAPQENEALRACLWLETPPTPCRPTLRLRKIVDAAQHFPPAQLARVLTSPTSARSGAAQVMMFVFGGFFTEVFFPTAPLRFRRLPGIVRKAPNFYLPTVSIREVPPLMEVIAAGHAKAKAGKVPR